MHPDELTIGEYIDDALSPAAREAVDRHLAGCSECRARVAAEREIRTAARDLPPVNPPLDAWRRIERAIRREPMPASASEPLPRPAGRPVSRPWLWLAAAAVVVLAVVTGMRWRPATAPAGGTTGAGTTAAAPAGAATAQSVEAELREAETHYQKAISGLEQIANAEKGSLDPNTAATLEKNLAVIDQAISESRTALKTEPNSEPAQQSLLDSFKAKLSLLQDTVALINEMRKGDDAGAARVVSGLKQKG